ncbi:uncharacterized protein Z519_05567 [Cladophialophora bantiana CBS 173.52]|uniref:Protein kinase domain-containing protein n=1 Tax=Cladophialophora bantiana (strain ATCC 10958 / CBS 173.52 / CDC B-1940 / NIH 8579) TaxID=1442370 RepID=A0A0D2EWL3_CLAB1|nr:uncharacterized protein Z519_05567 [Cladophialophora bantiana CBS 173.52]KIW94251.1 hypothetical protein Z519_05567 [Cladophialophora bantiana CBS 173.52]
MAAAPGECVGRMTTNILLEWGETDLESFFAEREPPVLGSEEKSTGREFNGQHTSSAIEFQAQHPGFAKFVLKKPNNTTYLSGGTSTYGAPELERSPKSKAPDPVSQSIDIWSFGCVFSIAATWVALGYKGILVYERLREDAIKVISSVQQAKRPPASQIIPANQIAPTS